MGVRRGKSFQRKTIKVILCSKIILAYGIGRELVESGGSVSAPVVVSKYIFQCFEGVR